MEAKIIQIGNSKGVRLPASLIKQYDLEEAINLVPTPDGILIQPAEKKARAGWEEQIKAVQKKYGVEEVDEDWTGSGNEFDEQDWTW